MPPFKRPSLAWPLLSVVLVLSGCGEPQDADRNDQDSDEPGWIELFDGTTLAGWTPKIKGQVAGEDPLQTFRVEDGAIVVSYENYESFDERFGHLFYRDHFDNYDLEMEVRFFGDQVAGGPGWAWRNSGAMIHGQSLESMGVDQNFPVSIEVQFLGGRSEGERPTGNLCTPGTHVEIDGELITRHVINSSSGTHRGDEWVRMRIEARADEIRHFVDGKLVLSYAKPQLDPKDPDAARLIEQRAGEVALPGGSISLQSESHPCAFRNIRIRPLP